MNTTAQVDGYIRRNSRWQAELTALRRLVLSCGLREAIKWRTPCFTLGDVNVVMIGVMKECCTLSFMKGVLLKDEHRLLDKPGKNTRIARMVRFTNVAGIETRADLLQRYILEAIAAERAGLKVDLSNEPELQLPSELRSRLDGETTLKAAFDSLTPGRRREYVLHISGAKRSSTRAERVRKCVPLILAGKGLRDHSAAKAKRR